MKKYAIIGFGGLGKVHFSSLMELEAKRGDIQLVAICNSDIESITKNVTLNFGSTDISSVDFTKYNLYTDYKEMIEKEDLDFVFITLPSHLHKEFTVYCLEHGIDVFVEKPMAITLEDCRAMVDTAKRYGRRLMVGQCQRFSDPYIILKEAVDTGKYGKLVKAEFIKKSPLPNWSYDNWLLKDDKSGSCIVDMHVHDVDIVMWLLGKPENTYTIASNNMADYECSYTLYEYPDAIVSMITDWGLHSTFEFLEGFNVTFEDAYIECRGEELTIYKNDEKIVREPKEYSPYYREEEEFVRCVVEDKPFTVATTESVMETMEQIFLEKEMLKAQRKKKGIE